MKRLISWLTKTILPASMVATCGDVSEALSGFRETLAVIRRAPVSWDEAAVQLDALRLEARRIGYPQYLYGLLSAARTARAVGAREFTAIEFGVAGGNGLVAMERHGATIERLFGISVRVVGFDNAKGLPLRSDPRDCPFALHAGEFAMDESKLRARLQRAELRLGDVTNTIRDFEREIVAPVGFVANDLDLYTSTRDSFALFDFEPNRLLPRVTLYFDDLLGYPYTTATGEWAAIKEFNSTHEKRQIGHIYGLKHCLGRAFRFAPWNELFFTLHVFDHCGYNAVEEKRGQPDLTLRA